MGGQTGGSSLGISGISASKAGESGVPIPASDESWQLRASDSIRQEATGHKSRNTNTALPVGELATLVGKVVGVWQRAAIVRRHDDDSVVVHGLGLQRVHHTTDGTIDPAHHGMVLAPRNHIYEIKLRIFRVGRLQRSMHSARGPEEEQRLRRVVRHDGGLDALLKQLILVDADAAIFRRLILVGAGTIARTLR